MNIDVGEKYKFNCSISPLTIKGQVSVLSPYVEHSGQIVTVERSITAHRSEDDHWFYVRADDGWRGAVAEGELEAIR